MPKMTRSKKLMRVIKRKLFKPILYASALSLLIYMVVGNIELSKRNTDKAPHFLITRISHTFDETEFMHLLLTVQEIRSLPQEASLLEEFVNSSVVTPCPTLLTRQLNRMNWEPQAFLSRVKKMFSMYEVFDRIKRLDETIHFLAGEVDVKRLPAGLDAQIDLLRNERKAIIGRDITQQEYDFVKEYEGLISSLIKRDTQL